MMKKDGCFEGKLKSKKKTHKNKEEKVTHQTPRILTEAQRERERLLSRGESECVNEYSRVVLFLFSLFSFLSN
jgi:hypothetical protein